MNTKNIKMLYGADGFTVDVPAHTAILEGTEIPAIANPDQAVIDALNNPIACPPLGEIVKQKSPKSVAITISDITRPVPNRMFLPPMLKVLNECGIKDSQITIIVGTGMHRPSTPEEHEILVGKDILSRIEIIDHRADDPSTLVKVSDDPPVSICKKFAAADLRIVTGYIEAHFMAGFSGGRKGVCPALVDLKTVQQFHGYKTLSSCHATTGNLHKNPCHEIALKVAKTVGVDFLFNVAITHDRKIAGIYCGDLDQAHRAGCKQVAHWTTAKIEKPFDLVITNGGGYPLDQTFYQTVKGMCTALPALHENSVLLQASCCAEVLGSQCYSDLLVSFENDWEHFLNHIEINSHKTLLDQWEIQMQTRILKKIGMKNLWFISDGIPHHIQNKIMVNPILSEHSAQQRMQRAIDLFVSNNPNATIAAIPQGPYTMIQVIPEAS